MREEEKEEEEKEEEETILTNILVLIVAEKRNFGCGRGGSIESICLALPRFHQLVPPPPSFHHLIPVASFCQFFFFFFKGLSLSCFSSFFFSPPSLLFNFLNSLFLFCSCGAMKSKGKPITWSIQRNVLITSTNYQEPRINHAITFFDRRIIWTSCGHDRTISTAISMWRSNYPVRIRWQLL